MAEPKNEMQYPGKKNFKASGHSNVKGNPGSSPWLYGRPVSADHTRTSSNKQGIGPAKPSAKIAKPLYAGNKDRSGI